MRQSQALRHHEKLKLKQDSADKSNGGGIMGKVIDLTSRLRNTTTEAHLNTYADVLNYEEQKKKFLTTERRQIKRTILSEFVSAMVVVPGKGLMRVGIYDISDQGISFDIEMDQGAFKVDEEICMRVYLNHKTYFPIDVKVKHVTTENSEAVVRHGTEFLTSTQNNAALQHFVKFIETISLGLRKDEGDFMPPKIS